MIPMIDGEEGGGRRYHGHGQMDHANDWDAALRAFSSGMDEDDQDDQDIL